MMSQTVVSRCVQFHVSNCRSLGLGVELKSKTIHDYNLRKTKKPSWKVMVHLDFNWRRKIENHSFRKQNQLIFDFPSCLLEK